MIDRIDNVVTPETNRVDQVAATLGIPRRTLHRHLRRAGLPSAKTIIAVCRLRRVIAHIRLQGESVKATAKLYGYPDLFTVSNQMKRVLGIRPTQARSMSEDELADVYRRALEHPPANTEAQ